MILSKGTKEVLINNIASAFQFTFVKPGAGATAGKEVAATAADATKLRIRGFGDIVLAGLTGDVIAQRARPENAGVVTIDASQATQIATSGTNLAGTVITVLVRQRSSDPLPEYINGDPGRYYKTRAYTFAVPVNATPLQVLTLLNTQIQNTTTLFPEADEPAELQISSSLAGNVLSITCTDSHVRLQVKVNDLDTNSLAVVPVLAPVIAVANDEGRGLYRNLKGGRLQTEGTNDPYAVPGPLELALAGSQYTSINLATATARPDLSGQAAADQTVATANKFHLFIAENPGNEPAIQDLVNFLSRADASVSKSYSTQFADGVTKALFLTNTAV